MVCEYIYDLRGCEAILGNASLSGFLWSFSDLSKRAGFSTVILIPNFATTGSKVALPLGWICGTYFPSSASRNWPENINVWNDSTNRSLLWNG